MKKVLLIILLSTLLNTTFAYCFSDTDPEEFVYHEDGSITVSRIITKVVEQLDEYENFALYDEIIIPEGKMLARTTPEQLENFVVYDEITMPETSFAKTEEEADLYYSDFKLYDEIERR